MRCRTKHLNTPTWKSRIIIDRNTKYLNWTILTILLPWAIWKVIQKFSVTETHLEPGQTLKMSFLWIFEILKSLTIFTKSSSLMSDWVLKTPLCSFFKNPSKKAFIHKFCGENFFSQVCCKIVSLRDLWCFDSDSFVLQFLSRCLWFFDWY